MRFARVHSRYALLVCVGLAWSCEEIDPVKTIDLCRGEGVISSNCEQCLAPPLDRHCRQCQEPGANPDCEPGSAVIADTSGSGGPAANSGTGAGLGASGTGVSGVSGGMSVSGSGGQAGMSAAASGAGAGTPSAGSAPVSPCDPGCERPFPACWVKEAKCVECVSASDCAEGAVCHPDEHRCVECTSASQCRDNRACDLQSNRCVDCNGDAECTKYDDPAKDVCTGFKCVDCDAQHGCSDPAKPGCYAQACVECVNDGHCHDPKRKCLNQTHACVECLASNDCRAPRPACNTGTHACVECLADTDCGDRHCLTAAKKCVECLEDAQCGTAAKSHCVTGNVCGGCTDNSHCAHLPATPACDPQSGECVACIDDSTCGDKACIRAEHKCSSVKRGSLAACAVCDADSQCATGQKCVPLGFGSAPATKNYCLYVRNTLNPCATTATSLNRPYSRMLASAMSIDGFSGSFCAPQTTCEALADASSPVGGKTCDNSDVCGVAGVDDAVCNSSSRCTYVCTADVDCPFEGLRMCTGTGAQKFCSQSTQ